MGLTYHNNIYKVLNKTFLSWNVCFLMIRSKIKKGEVLENLNAKNEYNRSSIPDPEEEPPTESEIKAEEIIKKEILRLKKVNKARLQQMDEDGDVGLAQPAPQPDPQLQP